MGEHTRRNLDILARTEAILGGILAMAFFTVMSLSPELVGDTRVALASAVLGSIAATYYMTLHPLLRWRHLAVPAGVLTAITAANFALIITATGGLDSPYYALWLLAIAISGVFGGAYTIAALLVTLGYYGYFLIINQSTQQYLSDHLIQLILTLVAGLLGEWLHRQNRDIKAESSRLRTVSSELSTEQLKSQTIISNLSEGVVVIDPKRRIQVFNRAAAQLTGWAEGEAIGLDYLSVIKLETDAGRPARAETDPFMQAWSSRQPILSENLLLASRSGRKLNLRLAVTPILDETGQPAGEIGLLHDISEQTAVERQKDEFISTASHEMRTPIAAIEGYLSLALNPKSATIDERARKYLESAHNSIGHLGQLFRDLLSVTKAEAAISGEVMEPVDLGKIVTDAVADMQFTAQAKSLTLTLRAGAAVGGGKSLAPTYYVSGHDERLREVVMNLIDNAIKYTPKGSVDVSLGGDDREVRITVADSGIGIAAVDMPHLFQKFYRIDNTDTRTIGGTGLGLYLCRKVVETHNGRIWVESHGPGKGSRFLISLPRLAPEDVPKLQRQADATITPTQS